MPIVRIPWTEIIAQHAGDTVLVALTHRHVALLNSLTRQLEWRATFNDGEYDFSDYDTVQSEVADLQANLNMPVFLTDLLTAIADIKAALEAQQTIMNCCGEEDPTGGLGYTDPITEDATDGVPQELIDAGLATDANDWPSFYEWQCAVGHMMVSNLKAKVGDFNDIFTGAGLILAGVTGVLAILSVFTGGASLLLVGLLSGIGSAAGVWTVLSSQGQAALPDQSEIEDARQDLVCAWTDAAHDGFDDRFTAFHAKLDELFTPIEAELMHYILDRSIMRAVYSGKWAPQNIAQTLVDQGFQLSDYDCTFCEQTYTETDLDIYAFKFDITSTGDAVPSLYGTTGVKLEILETFPSGDEIIHDTDHDKPGPDADTSTPHTFACNLQGYSPAPFDTQRAFVAGDWHITKDLVHLGWHIVDGTRTFTIALTNWKVLADNGSGPEWFDASIIDEPYSNTSSIVTDLVNNRVDMSATGYSATDLKHVQIQLRALVPD
jgi:hypothetical protein